MIEENQLVKYLGKVFRVVRIRDTVDHRTVCDLIDNKEFSGKYPLTVPTCDVRPLETETEE